MRNQPRVTRRAVLVWGGALAATVSLPATARADPSVPGAGLLLTPGQKLTVPNAL